MACPRQYKKFLSLNISIFNIGLFNTRDFLEISHLSAILSLMPSSILECADNQELISLNEVLAQLSHSQKLAALAYKQSDGKVSAALAACGVTVATFLLWRSKNKAFAEYLDLIDLTVTERLEGKMESLAEKGNVDLLKFALKARKPERYTERQHIEQDMSVTVQLQQFGSEKVIDHEPDAE